MMERFSSDILVDASDLNTRRLMLNGHACSSNSGLQRLLCSLAVRIYLFVYLFFNIYFI